MAMLRRGPGRIGIAASTFDRLRRQRQGLFEGGARTWQIPAARPNNPEIIVKRGIKRLRRNRRFEDAHGSGKISRSG